MVAPPFEDGAVKAMLALVLPAVAVPMVGAPGTVLLALSLPPPQAVSTAVEMSARARPQRVGLKDGWGVMTLLVRISDGLEKGEQLLLLR
jgi:hypothetical protein